MRDMVKLIHADNFFKEGEAEACRWTIEGLQYVDCEYGKTIPDFKLLFDGVEEAFSRAVGEELEVDKELSGRFIRPMNCQIRFESFESPNEWTFIIALQPTTFNIYHHLESYESGKVNAKSALDGYKWNYKNLFEWDIVTNIRLEANQGVFFRPWMFHSLEDGLVQYYRLKGKQVTDPVEE